MADYLRIKLTRYEADELRVAAEVQLRATREDSKGKDEWQIFRSLENAHRKLVTALGSGAVTEEEQGAQ